jgi:hypothetical protein
MGVRKVLVVTENGIRAIFIEGGTHRYLLSSLLSKAFPQPGFSLAVPLEFREKNRDSNSNRKDASQSAQGEPALSLVSCWALKGAQL